MAKGNTTNRLLGIILVLVVAILLLVTNPGAEAHRTALAREFNQRSPLAGAVGVGLLTSQLPDYHSIGVMSFTTEGERTTSIGVLGMVFVLDRQ